VILVQCVSIEFFEIFQNRFESNPDIPEIEIFEYEEGK